MTKNQCLKILKDSDLDVQSAKASFFVMDFVYQGYITSKKVTGVEYGPFFCSLPKDGGNFFQFLQKSKMSAIGRRLYRSYLKNHQSLNDKIDRHFELAVQLEKMWQIYRDKKNYSNAELASFFEKYLAVSGEWWRYGVIGEDKGEVINECVVPKFAKRHNLTIEEAHEAVSILTHPKEQSVLNIERLDFLKLSIVIGSDNSLRQYLMNKKFDVVTENKAIKGSLKKYIKKHFWIKTDFYKVIKLTDETVLESVRLILKEKGLTGLKQELKEIEFKTFLIKNEQKKILKNFNITNEDKDDLFFAQRIAYWVDQRKIMMMSHIYYAFIMLEEMGRRAGIAYEETCYYLPEELITLLRTGKKISAWEYKRRLSGMFITYENKDFKIFYGQDVTELLNIARHVDDVGDLRGMVASKGNFKSIIGRASVILNPEKQTFKDGDILVTSMTRVEYIPLMRRAKAIVTNEGGIACHAAIVSRELGIPCVIGTKVATQKLKDGQQIEIDLSTGIIKKVK